MTVPATARIVRGTPRNLARLARRLQAGELVAVPTETVYGLAANALDASACRKIFRAKGRPTSDPLIVHLHSLRQLDAIAVPNDAALKLARRFWPGPLTLVLPKKPKIPAIVSAGLPSVAVRMPSHPLFRRLLRITGLPLAAPSANRFGYVSPTTAEHVVDGLGRRVADVLDGGPSAIGLESTIVDLRDPNRPRVLRPGAVTISQLERALGHAVRGPAKASASGGHAQIAPGLLKRHYSPRTPVVLHAHITRTMISRGSTGDVWLLQARPAGQTAPNVFWLDARGRLPGAARRLFGCLRRLDSDGHARIHVELARGGGLALAINDRLRRAAAS